MKYRLVERRNPLDPNAPGKFYANAVNIGMVELKDFAGRIEKSTSLTRGDIMNVLEGFIDELPVFLKMGASVRLGNFATLRLTISSTGSDTFEAFTTENIRGVRIVFATSRDLKNSMLDISYERAEQ